MARKSDPPVNPHATPEAIERGRDLVRVFSELGLTLDEALEPTDVTLDAELAFLEGRGPDPCRR